MKKLLIVFGSVALIDYIPDGEFDATKKVANETVDAGHTVWNAAVNTTQRIVYTISN